MTKRNKKKTERNADEWSVLQKLILFSILYRSTFLNFCISIGPINNSSSIACIKHTARDACPITRKKKSWQKPSLRCDYIIKRSWDQTMRSITFVRNCFCCFDLSDISCFVIVKANFRHSALCMGFWLISFIRHTTVMCSILDIFICRMDTHKWNCIMFMRNGMVYIGMLLSIQWMVWYCLLLC